MRTPTSAFLLLLVTSCVRGASTDSLWNVWNSTAADSVRFKALGRMSWALMFSRPDSALGIAQLLYEQAGMKEDRRSQAMALTYQGIAYAGLGNHFAARQSYLEMRELYDLVGDRRGVAGACLNLGALHQEQGQRENAVHWYTQGITIFEELGDKRGLALAFNNVSGLYNELGDTASAIAYAQRCLAINQDLGDRRAIAGIIGNIAQMRMEAGQLGEAMELFRSSLSVRLALGDSSGQAHVLHDIGEAHRRGGALDSARWYFERSDGIRERLRDEPGLILTRTSMGYLALGTGAQAEARERCGEAAASARDLGLMPLERKACDCLYKALKGLGDEQGALAAFERFTALGDSIEQAGAEKQLQQLEFKRQVIQDSLAKVAALQQADAERTSSRARRPLFIGGGATVALVAALAARRRRRKRMSQG